MMSPLYACLVAAETFEDAAVAGAEGVRDAGTVLIDAAREFSPRIERLGDRTVVCDVSGLERLFGDARSVAGELQREAADRGLTAAVGVAVTRTAATLVAHARPGITVVEPGSEAAVLASLPLATLDALRGCAATAAPVTSAPSARFYRTSPMQELARASRSGRGSRSPRSMADAQARHDAMLETLARWGVRTLGDLAALPASHLSSRLGQEGVALQKVARGADTGPLVPLVPDERFEAHLDLEWPIEGLEPLSFVLGRLLEPVCAQLERRGRAAAVLSTSLRLMSRETHIRTLQLPAPMRDPRVLRTLAVLDFESHPPGAGIDAVTVHVTPTPGRILQFSLLERALPAPEQVSTLLARLSALMGEGRCGSPQLLDTHRPGAFELVPFAVEQPRHADGLGRGDAVQASGRDRLPVRRPHATADARPPLPICALRRFRHPVPVRVPLEQGRPARIVTDRPGVPAGRILSHAGPWRSSGDWWASGAADDVSRVSPGGHARTRAWNHDEWDVALDDGSVCRIYQDRSGRGWFMEGIMD
jgi:protein ImuB